MLTLPPALTARMAVTLDSIAPGRAGVNIVTGWQPKQYQQIGIELTPEHFARRHDCAAEYAQVMQGLWRDGRSNVKGDVFPMDDCVLEPRPTDGRIPIVCAGQSEKGLEFVAKYGDYNFVGAGGDMNNTSASMEMVAKESSTAANLVRAIKNPQPTGMLKPIRGYEQGAAMRDEIAEAPGLKGILSTFDDFLIGMEQFGQYIQPLMKPRSDAGRKTSFAA
ncbi:LLM class flavin-dependent oxidoreductase [Salipiger mangrovisoli]|uniref:LLM class flavin-dependent oxidoreductase n=1 Tax=Salipiger mangrovisoli TaxID=2865933 RepID=UPI001F11BCE0|nr:LLM class flavin-dependent oxidoreductase [Salipiger mangrovisoli]